MNRQIRMRRELSSWVVRLAQLFGSKLRNSNGDVICKAFVWPWRGKVHLIGLPREVQLRPIPMIGKRLSYWCQTIVWQQADVPDFPRLHTDPPAFHTVVCHVVICHLDAERTASVAEHWKKTSPDSPALIAYGGPKDEFDSLPPSVNAIYIADPQLRTSDHVRQRQEYSQVIQMASEWIRKNAPDSTHVHVVEFDALPTAPNVGLLLAAALTQEDADLLGYGLWDISGTVHPHYSHELNNADFMAFLRKISKREVHDRLLSMLGCSSIWTRRCFDAVASLADQTHVYLEIGIPTVAHHLGYRVRPMPASQTPFVTFEGDLSERIDEFTTQGAWLVHPCKEIWQTSHPKPALSTVKPRLVLCSHTYGAVANRAKATALSAKFDVLVCFPDFSGIPMMGKDGSAQDGESEDAPYQSRRLRRWPRRAGFTRCLMLGLSNEIKSWKPDIVLCEEEPWSIARWQCRLASWLSSKDPLFVEFTWENLPRQGIKGLLLRWVYKLAVVTTDGVICGNRGAQQIFTDARLPAWKSLRTGQLGVSPEEHHVPSEAEKSLWKRSLGLPEDAFVVGFCGRFVEEKGILDLFEAVDSLKARHPDIVLVYLGAGPLADVLRAKAEKAPWIRILPPVSHAEVPSIICNFDLFVLPSKPQLDPAKGIWEEQFGHVLIEAMMSSVPCIGSDSGGIPEVLDNPDLTFPPGNVSEIRRLIKSLHDSPDKRREVGASQRQKTLAHWTHEALAERYSRFLLGLYHHEFDDQNHKSLDPSA